MSRQLAYAVVADGETDRLLVPIIQWAVHRLDPGVEILEPEFRKRRSGVAEFLAEYRTGAMLVFVHRDAEARPLDERLGEFAAIDRGDVIPVVPVRMSESWLLCDGTAIAKAAGSPSSRVPVPAVAQIENIADPKDRLDDLLFGSRRSARGPARQDLQAFDRATPRERGRVRFRLQPPREPAGLSAIPGSARRALPVPESTRRVGSRGRIRPLRRPFGVVARSNPPSSTRQRRQTSLETTLRPLGRASPECYDRRLRWGFAHRDEDAFAGPFPLDASHTEIQHARSGGAASCRRWALGPGPCWPRAAGRTFRASRHTGGARPAAAAVT